MKISAAALLLLAPLVACEDAGPVGDVFIALQSDFAPFQTWQKKLLGDGPLEGHPAGPRVGYLKQAAPPGATEYPVRSMIVKTVERGATPQEWDIFALVKRGGGYNLAGAKNWEFFTLKINPAGIPIIVARGLNPADADADGGPGHGYADPGMTGITCNRCHGVVGTEQHDHILSAVLAPGAQ
jgi:hypothetical protein